MSATGLAIVEPSTMLRDWARTALSLDTIWAGGWAQSSQAATGIVLTLVGSTLDGPVSTWSTQWDAHTDSTNGGQPAASALISRLATALVRLPPRTVLGTTDDDVVVLYGGAVEGTVNIFPEPTDEPNWYRQMLTIDVVTIAVPPAPTP